MSSSVDHVALFASFTKSSLVFHGKDGSKLAFPSKIASEAVIRGFEVGSGLTVRLGYGFVYKSETPDPPAIETTRVTNDKSLSYCVCFPKDNGELVKQLTASTNPTLSGPAYLLKPRNLCRLCEKTAIAGEQCCLVCKLAVENLKEGPEQWFSRWRIVVVASLASDGKIFELAKEAGDQILVHFKAKSTTPFSFKTNRDLIPYVADNEQGGVSMPLVYFYSGHDCTNSMRHKLQAVSNAMPGVSRVAVDGTNKICFIYVDIISSA